jgi:hypothetical protein
MLKVRLRNPGPSAGLLLVLGLAGCAGLNDPFERAGTWRPEYVNDTNLAAMVADPRHLVRGVNDPESPAALSAAAVHRLMTDKVKPLPVTDISAITTSATPQTNGNGTGQ